MVFYLNNDWSPDAGGELVLYTDDGDSVLTGCCHRLAPWFVFLVSGFRPRCCQQRVSACR